MPCDADWKMTYSKDDELEKKLITVNNLSLSVYFMNEGGVDNPEHKHGHISQSIKNQREFTKTVDNYWLTQEKNYVLNPTMFTVKYTKNKSTKLDYHTTPKIELSVLFKTSIVIGICKEQIETMMRCIEAINGILKLKLNLHNRPLLRPKKENKQSYQSWWKYLISSVIEQNRTKTNVFSTFEKYFVMRKYISLYKRLKKFVRWLSQSDTGTLAQGARQQGDPDAARPRSNSDLAGNHKISRMGFG